MIRLHITAEGQTEELFVNQILANHLGSFDISTDVRCVMTSRDKRRQDRIFRGGMTNYAKAKNDILQWLKEEIHNTDVFFTTMFDFYALPDDFPCYKEATKVTDPDQQVKIIEDAFKEDIGDGRFIPYIQLHEYEALLLSKPQAFEIEYFDQKSGIRELTSLIKSIPNPELIDGGKNTSPSKRIIKVFPNYGDNKPVIGAMVAQEIGLEHMLRTCSHFAEWVKKLENLGEK